MKDLRKFLMSKKIILIDNSDEFIYVVKGYPFGGPSTHVGVVVELDFRNTKVTYDDNNYRWIFDKSEVTITGGPAPISFLMEVLDSDVFYEALASDMEYIMKKNLEEERYNI